MVAENEKRTEKAKGTEKTNFNMNRDSDQSAEQTGTKEEPAPTVDDCASAALFLSQSYPAMKAEQENIRKWQNGEKTFTTDDALAELISITPQGDSEIGVRVQTSNTSDQTAKIGTLLADGYVEKRQRQILQELYSPEMVEHINFLNWKIGIVDTAMAERMTRLQKSIFADIFFFGKTYSKLIEKSAKNGRIGKNKGGTKKLSKRKINLEKNKALDAVTQELIAVSSSEAGYRFVMKLMDEVREDHMRSTERSG